MVVLWRFVGRSMNLGREGNRDVSGEWEREGGGRGLLSCHLVFSLCLLLFPLCGHDDMMWT